LQLMLFNVHLIAPDKDTRGQQNSDEKLGKDS